MKIELTADDLISHFFLIGQNRAEFFRNIQDFFAADADEMMMGYSDSIKTFFGGVESDLDDLPPLS